MRFCVICGRQFDYKIPYQATCGSECEQVYEQDAHDILWRHIEAELPAAAKTLGFSTVAAAQAWLVDLRRQDTDEAGEVYFVSCRDSEPSYVKIGFSTDIPGRMESLQPGSPYEYELIGRMPGSIGVEHAIHNRFAHLRKHREWFYLTDELWDFIRQTTRNECQ